ncbi:HNH endonuclease [Streptomyces lasiicapitis]|uniref:HNH endonuclease n=1 Tax=Streptomyces lasiicapitis TaxID=1923961 RepID=UPI00367F424C
MPAPGRRRGESTLLALVADHVRPLAMGGTDTAGNVQVLCRGCHALKTTTEFGAAA